MHDYSIDSNERRIVPFLLASLAILSAWALSRFLAALHLSAPWWADAPSSMGFYGVFYALFDKHLWRTRLMRRLGLVKIPDLEGRWLGYLTSSFDDHEKHHRLEVHIFQTWTQIVVVVKTADSRSRSCVAAIRVTEPDGPALFYQYENEPQASAVKALHIHYGSAMLQLSDEKFLSGDYYAGRDRRTYGRFSCRRQLGTANAG